MVFLPRSVAVSVLSVARAGMLATALSGAVLVASLGQAAAQDIEARVAAVDPDVAAAADPVVARVEGVEVHESDVTMAEQLLGRTLPEPNKQLKHDKLVQYLVDSVILAKAAEKRNLGNDPQVLQRVEFSRDEALMERLLQVVGRDAATDEAARKAYDDAVAKAGTETELHLRAILFRLKDPKDEAEVQAAEVKANAAFDRIANGEDFAAVAKDVSESNSKQTGGDLGYMTRQQMGKEFADAAFPLDKDGVSRPFKSQFGWHILKVEDKRVRKPVDFDSVRDKFKIVVARKAQLDLITNLRSEVKVELINSQKAPEENAPAQTAPDTPADQASQTGAAK